jgi:hypothetical protein
MHFGTFSGKRTNTHTHTHTHTYIYSIYVYTHIYKVKVKFTLEQATKAQRRSRGITVLFL